MTTIDLLKLLHDRARHMDPGYVESPLYDAVKAFLDDAAAKPAEAQS